MKWRDTMKTYYYLCNFNVLFLSSCQNWIDVNPKTDIEAEEFFTSEDGFKSALTGVMLA